jgi:YfiH family protein
MVYRDLGIESGRVRSLRQIHSRKVLAVDDAPDGKISGTETAPQADGLVTRDRNTVLSVTVADCLPVFLYDTGTGAFGVLHSGWKGTGIVLEALALMEERWGVRPASVAAVLGPCICSRCYRVGKERALSYEAEFGGEGGNFPLGPLVWKTAGEEGDWHLDMQAANARILSGAGVRNIAVCRNCTFEDERLGSFRREGDAYARMTALAGYY